MSGHLSPPTPASTPPPSIAGITRRQGSIAVHWSDGRCSEFHHLWLRDNCRCEQCGDRSGGHRYLELGSIDPDIVPAEVGIDSAGALCIRWQGDDHLTRHPPQWLRAHCYARASIAERRERKTLWDGTCNAGIVRWAFEPALADSAVRLDLFERLNSHGFVLLDAVAVAEQQIERLAGLFGFIRQTHYGRVFDLISTPRQRILAETSHAIRPHHDELFRDPIPGLLIMHCLRASDCGGGASVLVDGFQAAENLRRENRTAFDLLCRVPVPHRRFLVDEVDDVALAAYWRSIELDRHGDVAAVHVNERTMAPLETDAASIEPMYRALNALLTRLYAPGACLRIRLEPGQAIVLDNHRVLHARDAFDGQRHIRQCHVDRDEFFSRLRALRRRRDRSAQRDQRS